MQNTIEKITVQRAEGLTKYDDFNLHEFTGPLALSNANAHLEKLSLTAPGHSEGYHKCDVVVFETNGDSYYMRFDLVNYECERIEGHLKALQDRAARAEAKNPPSVVRQAPPPPPVAREVVQRFMGEAAKEMIECTLKNAGFTDSQINFFCESKIYSSKN